MNNLKRCEQLKEEEYQGIFGVTKATFDKMLSILEEAYIWKKLTNDYIPRGEVRLSAYLF